MMLRYLVWVMDQAGFGACKEDRVPIAEFSDSLEVLAVYPRFLINVRRDARNNWMFSMRTEALPALEVIPEQGANRRDASEDVLSRHHLRLRYDLTETYRGTRMNRGGVIILADARS
jgi:hypothetical protein